MLSKRRPPWLREPALRLAAGTATTRVDGRHATAAAVAAAAVVAVVAVREGVVRGVAVQGVAATLRCLRRRRRR